MKIKYTDYHILKNYCAGLKLGIDVLGLGLSPIIYNNLKCYELSQEMQLTLDRITKFIRDAEFDDE